jgi:polyhydroxyalkanoate synthesis regulator phasin
LARRARRPPAVPDAVRRAVERTFQTTLGSATLTRERAQEVVDDVLKGAEQRAARAGRGVRGVGQRQRDAAVGVGDRLRDVIADLRGASVIDLSELRVEVQKLRRRVDRLEDVLTVRNGEESKPKARRSGGASNRRSTASRRRSAGVTARRSAGTKRTGGAKRARKDGGSGSARSR